MATIAPLTLRHAEKTAQWIILTDRTGPPLAKWKAVKGMMMNCAKLADDMSPDDFLGSQ